MKTRKYLVVYEKTKTGYSAYVPDLPGVIATGKTRIIIEKNIFDAIQFHIEGLKEEKLRIPKSQADSEVFVFAV
jgi:predicted RNase H-like HicB family nuclease